MFFIKFLIAGSFLIFFIGPHCFGQETIDSIKYDSVQKKMAKPKFSETLYARVMPICVYTGYGYLKDRINQNIEIGKSIGMIDLGIAFGRNALRPDSMGNGTSYLEGKFNMDIAQFGIFSSEMVIGAGGVFNSKNYLMLELSYTIFAQLHKNYGMGLITGFYDYSGDRTDLSRSMFGIFFRYGLIHSEGGIFNSIVRLNKTHGTNNIRGSTRRRH